MSYLTLLMIVSFPVLAFLWVSYRFRGDNKPTIPFGFWCFTQVYCFIAILGVGMMQAHLDCMSLWGDCYAGNYPIWLADYKPLLLNSITIWCLLASCMVIWNVTVRVRNKLWGRLLFLSITQLSCNLHSAVLSDIAASKTLQVPL